MNYWLFLLPLFGAGIGWLINRAGLKMLFHPREPKKIGFFTVQGLFPKRQKVLAAQLGKMASAEFLALVDIEKNIGNPENFQKISPVLEGHIDQFLRVKLATEMPMISAFIGEKTIVKLKAVFLDELNTLFPIVMQQYAQKLQEDLDLEKMIAQKINGLSSEKLEKTLHQVLAKECRSFERLGAIAGFLIGLLQVVLTWLTS